MRIIGLLLLVLVAMAPSRARASCDAGSCNASTGPTQLPSGLNLFQWGHLQGNWDQEFNSNMAKLNMAFAPGSSHASSELATILSDETGSGSAVFNASPLITLPFLGAFNVGGLPVQPSGQANRLALVVDGIVDGSCTQGGGSGRALCVDTGSQWKPLGPGLTVCSTSGGLSTCTGPFLFTSRVQVADQEAVAGGNYEEILDNGAGNVPPGLAGTFRLADLDGTGTRRWGYLADGMTTGVNLPLDDGASVLDATLKPTADQIAVGRTGAAAVATSLPHTGGNALGYDTGSHTFSVVTAGGGGAGALADRATDADATAVGQTTLSTVTLSTPVVGRHYRVTAGGTIKKGGTDTGNYRVTNGATTLCEFSNLAVTTGALPYRMVANITVRSIGASADVYCNGSFDIDDGNPDTGTADGTTLIKAVVDKAVVANMTGTPSMQTAFLWNAGTSGDDVKERNFLVEQFDPTNIIGATTTTTTTVTTTTVSTTTTTTTTTTSTTLAGQGTNYTTQASMVACWFFNTATGLGADSCNAAGGQASNLTNDTAISFDAGNKQEGTHSALGDGNNDLTCVPTSGTSCPDLDFGAGAQFSGGCWVRELATSGQRQMIMGRDTSTNGWWFERTTGTNLIQINAAPSASCATVNTATSAATVTTSAWTHVAFTISNTELRVYVNGVQSGPTGTRSGTGICNTSAESFYLMAKALSTSAGVKWNGNEDECWLSNDVKSAVQICEICRKGLNGQTSDRGAACGSCTLP